MNNTNALLVGDIGGTNCRLALVRDHQLIDESITTYSDASYPSLVDAVRAFLSLHQTKISAACLAIAGPITGDAVKLTNNAWQFSIKQTQRDLNLNALSIINDFEAIALSLPHLRDAHVTQIGSGDPIPHKPKVAIGPGTGYGAAKSIHTGNSFIALPTEGGHVSIAPSTEQELALFMWLLRNNLQITREQLLSGPGLERIYCGLCAIENVPAQPLSAAEIQHHAVDNRDAQCVAALTLFCELLGTAARDQALDELALGGVYIAGGIVKRFIPFLRNSAFRKRFEDSHTMHSVLKPIPTYVITADNPGLIGAAAHAATL